MSKVHTNNNTAWFILENEHIYGNIYNFQYTTQMSNSINALIKAGCTTTQIYSYFQNIGMNVYEEQIILYLKYGVNKNIISE